MEKPERPKIEVKATREFVGIIIADVVRIQLTHEEAEWVAEAIGIEIENAALVLLS